MKKTVTSIFIMLCACTMACHKALQPTAQSVAISNAGISKLHPLQDSVQAIIDKHIAEGIAGIQVTIKNGDGNFVVNGGYAKTESNTPFRANENEWIFSITKTFTASLVMKMQEQGTINLDNTINQYLPKNIADSITGSDIVTVRMLLNHTSGLINFTELPEFLAWQFADPLHQPGLKEKLMMTYNRPLNFSPGSDFSYSNTNYLLLDVILQKVSGQPYQSLLQHEIIEPLQLTHTYFKLSKKQLQSLWFPNYYADIDSNNVLENVTPWNCALGNTSEGYGGIASTASDVIKFYDALLNGLVVNKNSLKQMTAWVQGQSSTQPDYGLGLEYFQFAPNTTPQFGHEGDGVGCTTQILFVPATSTYLYINCIVGRQIPGPFLYKTTDFKNELCSYIARWRP